MSWTDNKSIEIIKKLRGRFKVKTLVETGTFMGINARVHSFNFEGVLTCEIIREYLEKSKKRLERYSNVKIFEKSSPEFLKEFANKYKEEGRDDIIIFYLDAHFYNPSLPKDKRFVVLDELKSLEGFNKGIVIIHDFDNGLGHITYDRIPLDFKLLKNDLINVNPNFRFYTNELSSCDIVKSDIKSLKKANLEIDEETIDNLEYAWSSPRLAYRGILYAIPEELEKEFELKRIWS